MSNSTNKIKKTHLEYKSKLEAIHLEFNEINNNCC